MLQNYYSACNLKVREICALYSSETVTSYGISSIPSFISMPWKCCVWVSGQSAVCLQ